MLPLYPILTGKQNTYEYIDDPRVTAVSNALERVIGTLPNTRPDLQYNAVITTRPIAKELEDELFNILSSDNRFFPRPDEDISDIISQEESNQLNSPGYSSGSTKYSS